MIRETLSSRIPVQPRHPRLEQLLEANRARLRVVAKRAARRLLLAHGIDPATLTADAKAA